MYQQECHALTWMPFAMMSQSVLVSSVWSGVDVLGLKRSKHQDWFDDNDDVITRLLGEKNRLYKRLLAAVDSVWIAAEKAFKDLKSRVQREIRHLKNKRWVSLQKCRDPMILKI